MTTDTAVGVTKLVVEDKIPLDKIPYVVCVSDTFLLWNFLICPLLQDYPTIKFNARESVEMPFRTYEKHARILFACQGSLRVTLQVTSLRTANLDCL